MDCLVIHNDQVAKCPGQLSNWQFRLLSLLKIRFASLRLCRILINVFLSKYYCACPPPLYYAACVHNINSLLCQYYFQKQSEFPLMLRWVLLLLSGPFVSLRSLRVHARHWPQQLRRPSFPFPPFYIHTANRSMTPTKPAPIFVTSLFGLAGLLELLEPEEDEAVPVLPAAPVAVPPT